ncbi:MAG: gamma-glutamyl-gamma-aminobutyrate hydrolase family protein [Candidatus Iainarchaeum archaeon]|uniref:Gamma-glutamyl-gamma-aminobutyrate hydrolase family protein n=1 Tax=Candidatus Iainarchaeum sp. TaxID=3101447 RepID=A0A7T9I1U9_9ARCH|nr:MAG: gamma-glutamyl-gamma-aminobutyrate hydrolase family protein [Candidatus Diapherotrites archaeon]
MTQPYVLIVNSCQNEDLLTKREFVWPIQRALHTPSKTIHISKLKKADVLAANAIIFSGCQLKDNGFVKRVPKLKWLKDCSTPMLGICAGHQLLGMLYGGKISHAEKPMIGWTKLKKKAAHPLTAHLNKVFSAYELHGNLISVPKGFKTLVSSAHNPNEMMVHAKKKIVGVEFHPEVRNERIIQKFVE